MTDRLRMSRRAALRGLGATLALPMLEAMAPRATSARAMAASAATAPRRMAFIYVPNGMNMKQWTPATLGGDFALSPTLQPLAGVKRDLLVLSGLTHDKARPNGDGPGDHARSAGAFLTACQPRKTHGADLNLGESVDQAAARKVGGKTRLASLELGIDRGANSGNCDSGYSCAYSANISWKTASTPNAKEVNPRLVFERLFGNADDRDAQVGRAKRERYRKSILDLVAEEARALQRRIGKGDQRKLDEYLTSVREVERRIVRNEGHAPVEVPVPGFQAPSGAPRDFSEHVRLMSDLLVLAFQADVTRIATFMFANAGSNRSYPSVDVKQGHHSLSHHGNAKDKLEMIAKINQHHVAQLAYFLDKLKATPEGDGNLLDQSMILYGCAISDGNRHNHDDLPMLLAGGGGGTIRSGRHVRYEKETPAANLFLSMLDRMDAPVESLGDSTGRLKRLDG